MAIKLSWHFSHVWVVALPWTFGEVSLTHTLRAARCLHTYVLRVDGSWVDVVQNCTPSANTVFPLPCHGFKKSCCFPIRNPFMLRKELFCNDISDYTSDVFWHWIAFFRNRAQKQGTIRYLTCPQKISCIVTLGYTSGVSWSRIAFNLVWAKQIARVVLIRSRVTCRFPWFLRLSGVVARSSVDLLFFGSLGCWLESE